jgi:RNA polymerase sigma-70 factor (ECF subfamily)
MLDVDFETLIGRVRAGDAEAAAELVKQLEAAIRVAVRIRLFDPVLRRQLDSMDICQSVLASFFVRVAAGQYDLRHPSQLVALLTKMAHNKLKLHVGYNLLQCRDVRRLSDTSQHALELASSAPGPARQAEGRELLRRAWQHMDGTMREIATYRLNGETWDVVASKMGGTGESRRKQYQRGMDEIARVLGIDDDVQIGAKG